MDTIIRYYCRQTSQPEKRLTPDEAQAIVGAGMKLGVVYQGAGNAASSFSDANGTQDGSHARDYASRVIGQPRGSAIYFAVDYDASPADIRSRIVPYFAAVRRALASGGGEPDYLVGVYGSGAVCQALLDARLVSLTWVSQSRGFTGTAQFVASGRWNLKQGPESTLCGMSIDSNVGNPQQPQFGAFSSLGGAGVAVAPTIYSTIPAIFPATGTSMMGGDVSSVQERLRRLNYETGAVDGVYGSLTRGALLAFQSDNKLPLTGVADAATLVALDRASPRPLDPARVGATADDLRALGSQTIRQADNTKRVGLISSILGVLGIGNSAMVQIATPAATPAPAAQTADALRPVLTKFLSELQPVLSQPAAATNDATITQLRETARHLQGLNLQNLLSPDNIQAFQQIKALIPPDVVKASPELGKVLQATDALHMVKPQLQTIVDVLPTFFTDGTALNLVAKGAAVAAQTFIPGFGGSLAALGIGLAANFLGNKIINARVQDHRTGANRNI